MSDSNATFIGKFDEACLLFDAIFKKISTTRKYNEPAVVRDIDIDHNGLSNKQCEAINILAGLLSETRDASQLIRPRSAAYKELSTVVMPWTPPQQHLMSTSEPQTESERVSGITISLLRQYLMRQLCHTTELEKDIEKHEGTIVDLTHENKMLRVSLKMYSAPEHADVMLDSQDVPGGGFIGCYVRKKFQKMYFFGIITRFNAPWYQVHVINRHSNVQQMNCVNRWCTKTRMLKKCCQAVWEEFYGRASFLRRSAKNV